MSLALASATMGRTLRARPVSFRFQAPQEALKAAVRAASRVAPSRPSHPALGGVLIAAQKAGRVEVTGYDLTVGVRASFQARVETPGVALVPAGVLASVVGLLEPLDVALEATGARLTVRCGQGLTRLPLDAGEAEDYPDLPAADVDGPEAALGLGALQAALAHVLPAVPRENQDVRSPIVYGVSVKFADGGLSLIGGDGKIFSLYDLPGIVEGDDIEPLVVPLRFAQEIARMPISGNGLATIRKLDGVVQINHGNMLLTGNLVAGDYPPVESVVPAESKYVIQVEREPLLAAITRLSIVSSIEDHSVICDFQESRIALATDGGGAEAAESVACDHGAKGIRVGFAGAMLLTTLRAIEGDVVKIGIDDSVKPTIWTSADSSGNRFIVMPRVVE